MANLDAAGPNADQITYWNSEAGDKWVRNQQAMDRMLAPVAEILLNAAAPKDGETILDVGCGCGATTFAAAKRAGSRAHVLGVDISEGMLAWARKQASPGGPEFLLADAQTHSFPAARFDLVISRFGVMFFADPKAAFSNLHRALKLNGRFAFVCWQPLKANAWVTIPMSAALPHLPPVSPPDPNAPGPFAFADPARVEDILRSAGFSQISITPVAVSLSLAGPDGDALEDAVHHACDIGPVSRLLQEATEPQRAAARDAIRDAFAPRVTPSGVALDGAIWRVEATA